MAATPAPYAFYSLVVTSPGPRKLAGLHRAGTPYRGQRVTTIAVSCMLAGVTVSATNCRVCLLFWQIYHPLQACGTAPPLQTTKERR